jgi:hypothetical protein
MRFPVSIPSSRAEVAHTGVDVTHGFRNYPQKWFMRRRGNRQRKQSSGNQVTLPRAGPSRDLCPHVGLHFTKNLRRLSKWSILCGI